jgi:hypothetical protein
MIMPIESHRMFIIFIVVNGYEPTGRRYNRKQEGNQGETHQEGALAGPAPPKKDSSGQLHFDQKKIKL